MLMIGSDGSVEWVGKRERVKIINIKTTFPVSGRTLWTMDVRLGQRSTRTPSSSRLRFPHKVHLELRVLVSVVC